MSHDLSEEAKIEQTDNAHVPPSFHEGMQYEDAFTLLIQRTSYHSREELIDVLQTGPASKFKGLKPAIRTFLISALESNHPLRWSALKVLMDDACLSIDERRIFMNAWIESSLRFMEITRDDFKSGVAKLKRDKIPAELHQLLDEIYKAVTNHDSMRLPSLTEAELDDLARNGDTRFKQGSEERMDIISYRADHGLPLHHADDIKAYIDKH